VKGGRRRPGSLVAFAFLAFLGGCRAEPAAPARPALVVEIVVDQLPERLLDTDRRWFAPDGGFTRLLGDHAFVAIGHHAHAVTSTCPGHATLSTGASPAVHGIPANRWYIAGKSVYCADPDGDGTPDPGALRAEPLADRVIAAGGRVASVGLKDRAPVLLGGRHPTVVSWFDRETGAFVGAPWAAAVHPDLTQTWTPLRPADYARIVPDDQPFESTRRGRTFAHAPPTDVDDWLRRPAAGSALTDVAIAAVDQLSLGTGDQPDLLAVAYSEVDYVGHTWTVESWEAMDDLLRLDGDLGRLFAHLDEVLPGKWAVILSSDHGAIPGSGPRIDPKPVVTAAEDAMHAAGLPGELVFDEPMFWLPEGGDLAVRSAAARAVAATFAASPHIAGAWAWVDGTPPNPAIAISYDRERSGDGYVLVDAGVQWLWGDGTGTEHGTPYPFDQDVPFLLWGAGVRPGVATDPVDTREFAPTAGALLAVGPPAQAERGPLAEALVETREPRGTRPSSE
jgi:predicted AlkP superfamily pyrophosphatase or phosphodiesterase